jgi:hypothetical protein
MATLTATSLALPPEVPHVDNSLPESLEVRIGGKVVHGFLGAPESLGLIETPSEGDEHPWQDEGFLYRPKADDRDQFQVVAWSTQGRAGQILSVAEDKLIDIIRGARPADDDPGGFVFSGRKKKEIGGKATKPRRKYPKGLTVAQSPQTLRAPAKPTAPAAVAVAKPPEAPKGITAGGYLWSWLLFLLALLLLLLWPLSALIKKMRRKE